MVRNCSVFFVANDRKNGGGGEGARRCQISEVSLIKRKDEIIVNVLAIVAENLTSIGLFLLVFSHCSKSQLFSGRLCLLSAQVSIPLLYHLRHTFFLNTVCLQGLTTPCRGSRKCEHHHTVIEIN
jgi:hypothetical protein